MGHKAQGVDPLAVEVHSDNKPKVVPAYVEYNHLFSALDPHGISTGISSPHLGQMLPPSSSYNLAPRFQVAGSFGMLSSRLRQKRGFDYAHAYNLYSISPAVNSGISHED